MKNITKALIIIITAVILSAICIIAGNAQTKVVTDKQGNYTAVVKQSSKGSSKAVSTGKTCTVKGVSYPVYESKNGKLFINN